MKISRWMAELTPSADQIKSMLEDEGFEVEEETYSPGNAVKEHAHPFDEVRIVVSGVLRYNVAGNEFILRGGDRLELPSNTRHWTKAEGDSNCLSYIAYRVT